MTGHTRVGRGHGKGVLFKYAKLNIITDPTSEILKPLLIAL